jgi:mannose-1-phosphate guanylyltransferase
MSSSDPHLWAVILAGGIGSRFWPLSTPARPKQILPLVSDDPLIAETVERILPAISRERIRILTGESLAAPLLSVLPELGEDNLLLEPEARGTAPVLAWAAHRLLQEDPDAVMVSLHADHAISPAPLFLDDLRAAASRAAAERALYTIGIPPTRPDTGYGYIRLGERLPDGGEPEAYRVSRFEEKPDLEGATRYLEAGDTLWNTGIFAWRAADLLEEIRAVTPEMAGALHHLDSGDAEAFFAAVPTLSIDEGVLERSQRVRVVRARFRWDDVGTWPSLFRSRPVDAEGNVTMGRAVAVDTRDSALISDDGPVVALGVRNLVVVRANGVTFVADREHTDALKEMLADLPPDLRNPAP